MLAEQTTNADGTITTRPIALADGREIGAAEAAKILGFSKETISSLCRIGGSRGGLSDWQPVSARGNGKWRISLQSVLDYKAGRMKAAQEGIL